FLPGREHWPVVRLQDRRGPLGPPPGDPHGTAGLPRQAVALTLARDRQEHQGDRERSMPVAAGGSNRTRPHRRSAAPARRVFRRPEKKINFFLGRMSDPCARLGRWTNFAYRWAILVCI